MRIAVVPAGPAEGEHALLPGNKAPRNPFRVGWPRLPSPTRTRTKLAEEGTNSKPSLRHPDPWKLGGPADAPSPALEGTLSPSDGALPLVGECQEGRRGFSLAPSDGERAGVRGFPWGWGGAPPPPPGGRGEGGGGGISLGMARPSSPRPSPPSAGGEGEAYAGIRQFLPGSQSRRRPEPTDEANRCNLRHVTPKTLQKALYVGCSESGRPLQVVWFGWSRFPVPEERLAA